MTTENHDQPTAREILDVVLHSQDVLASAIGRLEGDVAALRKELKGDVLRLERRIARLEGF
jgi:hypothetical protein